MDVPSIPIFVADAWSGESVRAIPLAPRQRRPKPKNDPRVASSSRPSPEPLPEVRRAGAKPVQSFGASSIGFLFLIVLTVAGASVAALRYAGPETWDAHPRPAARLPTPAPTVVAEPAPFVPTSILPPVLTAVDDSAKAIAPDGPGPTTRMNRNARANRRPATKHVVAAASEPDAPTSSVPENPY